MKYQDQVALILEGAHLWANWIRLNLYAGAGSSPTAKALSDEAQKKWQTWRDAQEPQIFEAAQKITRITKEFCE